MSYDVLEKKPLLNFSESQERASLIDTDLESMSPRRRRRVGGSKRKKVRVSHGRIGLKISGFKGIQHLTASELVRHIPVSKLRAAGKKVLKRSGRKIRKGRKKRGRKQRGRKRK